jgi:hypothetical protein
MTITDIKFDPAPKVERSKRNTLFQMRRKVIFQKYCGTEDELGARPYSGYEDYLTGADGTGVWADLDTPHPDDVTIALQHAEILTHSILVRYDSRIDPRQIIKYTNLQTGQSRYFYIITLTNPDFEWHYLRIGAQELMDFPPDE